MNYLFGGASDPPIYAPVPIPVWLRQAPAEVLFDLAALGAYLNARGLPSPSAVALATERVHRRFLAQGGH